MIPTATLATNEERGDRMANEAGAEPPVAGRVGGSDGPRPLTWQDVRGDTRRRADDLVSTESEAVALVGRAAKPGLERVPVTTSRRLRRHADGSSSLATERLPEFRRHK